MITVPVATVSGGQLLAHEPPQPDPLFGSVASVYSVRPFGPTRTLPRLVDRDFTTSEAGFGVGLVV